MNNKAISDDGFYTGPLRSTVGSNLIRPASHKVFGAYVNVNINANIHGNSNGNANGNSNSSNCINNVNINYNIRKMLDIKSYTNVNNTNNNINNNGIT